MAPRPRARSRRTPYSATTPHRQASTDGPPRGRAGSRCGSTDRLVLVASGNGGSDRGGAVRHGNNASLAREHEVGAGSAPGPGRRRRRHPRRAPMGDAGRRPAAQRADAAAVRRSHPLPVVCRVRHGCGLVATASAANPRRDISDLDSSEEEHADDLVNLLQDLSITGRDTTPERKPRESAVGASVGKFLHQDGRQD